jgi:hypothetical protein
MRWTRSAWAFVIPLLVALCGCGGSSDDGTASTSETTRQHSKAPRRKVPVPASLGRVESGAEDTIDFAHAGDRVRVVATARALLRAAEPAAADLREAGVRGDRIAELRAGARLLKALAPRAQLARVSLAANRISALMPEFYALYRDPVPPDVLKLDYLDREAQLRSLAGDPAAVPRVVSELASTWTALRPRVIGAGGRRVAAWYSRHVAAMRRLASGPGEALQREAGTGLQTVDQLEHQFRQG